MKKRYRPQIGVTLDNSVRDRIKALSKVCGIKEATLCRMIPETAFDDYNEARRILRKYKKRD